MSPRRPKRLSGTAEFIVEQLAPLGEMAVRQMYGCTTLMRDGRMFALIDGEGQLFVKVDAVNRTHFDEAGCRPFTYEIKDRSGAPKKVSMSYLAPPPSALEDQDELFSWVRIGLEAAARVPEKKVRKRKPSIPNLDDLEIG